MQQPLDGSRVEQVSIVFHVRGEGAFDFFHRQDEVEFARGGIHVDVFERGCTDGHRRRRTILENEHRLDQRRIAGGALGMQLLDQLVERHLLVSIGLERRSAYAVQQFSECRIAGKIGAQDEGVDEEANQALGLELSSPRDR